MELVIVENSYKRIEKLGKQSLSYIMKNSCYRKFMNKMLLYSRVVTLYEAAGNLGLMVSQTLPDLSMPTITKLLNHKHVKQTGLAYFCFECW